MSDVPQTAEAIALTLFREIAASESKGIKGSPMGTGAAPDREWILTTYAQCLAVVRGIKPQDVK